MLFAWVYAVLANKFQDGHATWIVIWHFTFQIFWCKAKIRVTQVSRVYNQISLAKPLNTWGNTLIHVNSFVEMLVSVAHNVFVINVADSQINAAKDVITVYWQT